VQHCLFDCSVHDAKFSTRESLRASYARVRESLQAELFKLRVRRVKYSGAVAVLDKEQKRLRAIRKWKNYALRYQFGCYWYHTCPMLRRSAVCACSRAFATWVLHVRERQRLRQVLWPDLVASHAPWHAAWCPMQLWHAIRPAWSRLRLM
jgi:hypothetical protein